MKDTRAILYNLSAEQGWCGATMLELCLNYIEAQESNEAFEDFLMQHAEMENDWRGAVAMTLADMEWEFEMVKNYDGWEEEDE